MEAKKQKTAEPLALDRELDPARFVALSPGIGLGEPKPKLANSENPKHLASRTHAAREQATRETRAAESARPSAKAAFFPPDPSSSHQSKPFLSLGKRLLAYSIDFVLIAFTLSTGVLGFFAWKARDHGFEDFSVSWEKILGAGDLFSHPMQAIAGVYAIFFAYLLIFKLMAGVTLGESFLLRRTR